MGTASGMTYGAHIIVVEIIVDLRKSNHDLQIIATVSFPSFPCCWSKDWKQRYGHTFMPPTW
jgi:hypothetical protein